MTSKRGRRRSRGAAEEAQSPPPAQGKLSTLFDIPPSALGGVPQIELAGNREAVVDGCKGVLEYDENVVKLATDKMTIRFEGRGLQIKVLTHDSAIVTGFITNIEFIT